MRVFLIALLLYFAHLSMAHAYTVELTKEEVQEAVSGYFPVKQITPLVMLTAHDPVVMLKPDSHRIGLEFSVLAIVPGIFSGEGRALIDGDLEYRNRTGEFYLRDPKIRDLKLYDTPAEVTRSIRLGLQQLMQQSLPIILVYKLQDGDLKQQMAKSVLTSVNVRKGKVVLDLSMPGLNLLQ